jgi:hypothetical protein
MPTTTAGTEHFLGSPPAPAAQWIGRVTHLNHNPRTTWTEGQLTLPAGVHVPWIAHSYTVRQHADLFHPTARVIVTAHKLGGPLYLTGIRAATTAEWADAIASLDHQTRH